MRSESKLVGERELPRRSSASAMPTEQAPSSSHIGGSRRAVAASFTTCEEGVVLHAGRSRVVEHADIFSSFGPDPSPAAAQLGAAVVAGVHFEEEEPKPVLLGVDRK